jgi:two-component system, NarL family, nitrate/nitrite response regulator NarL
MITGLRRGAKARVFLLSDVRLYREGLLFSLARQSAFEVLDASDFSSAALARVAASLPDVIILDIGAPDSFAVAKSLSVRLPNAKIIAFAVSEIDDLVLACAEAGIAGYVAPEGSEEDLVAAVECALRGELYCSPRIAGVLLRRVTALSTQRDRTAEPGFLTQRECQVLALVSEGMSNKEIGRALRIVDSTVKNHVHNILEKLQVHRRGEAAVRFRAMQSVGRRSFGAGITNSAGHLSR